MMTPFGYMKYKIPTNILLFSLMLVPAVASAVVFKPLVGIPGVSGNTDFNTYINALYALSISLAGLLAVIKIIVAGVKWMLSDVVTSKQEAKSDMQGALLGLLIVVSAVVVLNVINPQLTQTTLFVSPVDVVPLTPGGSTGPTSTPANPAPPIPSSTFACIPDPNGAWDCGQAELDCFNSGGRVYTGPVSSASQVTCNKGENKTLFCAQVLNTTTNQNEPFCDIAQDFCSKPGYVYTQLSDYKANCYMPF